VNHPTRALLSRAEIRRIEADLTARLPPHTLMISAAHAAASKVMSLIAPPARVLVMCGPGNNGGDGALVAAGLAAAGYLVDVVQCFAAMSTDPDCSFAWAQLLDQNKMEKGNQHSTKLVRIVKVPAQRPYDLVVDALLGLGQTRPIEPDEAHCANEQKSMAWWILWANQQPALRLALDGPTGLNFESGQQFGAIAFKAQYSVTFLADKPGLHMNDGLDLAGAISLERIGCESSDLPAAYAKLKHWPDDFTECAIEFKREFNVHKGSFGNVAVFGGAAGMTGAALLAARMALKGGAGRTWLGLLETCATLDSQQPELMVRAASDLVEAIESGQVTPHCVVVGPGLSQARDARQLLLQIFKIALVKNKNPSVMVLDADALNLIAQDPKLKKVFSQLPVVKIITPHPLEAARLLEADVEQVQDNRFGAALRLAKDLKAICVLKGAGTVIAAPTGSCRLIGIGAPALASGGTGDVLAGLLGALVASFVAKAYRSADGIENTEKVLHISELNEVVCLAVGLHATAGKSAQAHLTSGIGYTASELIDAIRFVLNDLVAS
jgi:ADP-dependent NAD(P)H-hydrate dehydratase / NAD(P)H-hydrate epimerase